MTPAENEFIERQFEHLFQTDDYWTKRIINASHADAMARDSGAWPQALAPSQARPSVR